ncbi:MAG: RICIN domain-containing protein [Clostridia bacterium]|nr:RICIN domain-containing protein [Clostridia bacterium]
MKKRIVSLMVLMVLSMSLVASASEIEKSNVFYDQIEIQENAKETNDLSDTNATTRGVVAYWATTNKATKMVSSPYDGINTTIVSLGSGSELYILERDYDYFYVQRLVNGKYQRGYIKISDLNYSEYVWVSHNVFEKGTTKFSASSQQVLSGPGTENSYEKIGTIYKGETPLLILRTELNEYNNIKYSFIQYMVTSTGEFKRGWVPSSSVSVQKAASDDSLIDNNKVFYLESKVSNKMIQTTSTSSGGVVLQQPKSSSNNQLFKIEKASTGYYRFILQSNTNLSLQVLGNQMAEGSQLGVATKGTTTAPTKAEEFEVTLNDDGSYHLKSRCTGRYRSVHLNGGNTASGTKIISSKATNTSSQRWNFQPKIKGGKDIAVIKVGDSTGRACVSMYEAFDNLNVYYANRDSLISTTKVSKNTKFNLPHIKFAIKNSSVFYINGHGYPNPKIGGSNSTYTITPSNIGFSTSDRTRWGILSPCDQLNKDGSAVVWAKQALRNGVRGILGYYDLAPEVSGNEDDPQPQNIAEFTSKLGDGKTFIAAWKAANDGFLGITGKSNWAAIYHSAAENDTLSSYNKAISDPAASTIYYYARNASEGTLSTATVNELRNMAVSVDESAVVDSSVVSKQTGTWTVRNGMNIYEKSDFDIGKAAQVTIEEKEALNKVGLFMKENNIEFDADSGIEYGFITRSRFSDDETCFVDEEVLAYTFKVKSNTKNMYFEVIDNGVANFASQSY